MAIADIPILSMLRTRMRLGAGAPAGVGRKRRQCRHAKIPSARPRAAEIRRAPLASPATVSAVALTRTADSHLAGVGLSQSPYRSANARDFEVRPTGNAVNLEDEMMKVAANQMDYQAATALYTRSLGLIKTALGKR